VSAVSYLLVIAAFARGFADYPDQFQSILILVITMTALLAAEPLLSRRSRIAGAFVISGQIIAMVAGYLIAPQTDTWALLMLPACVSVIRDYPKWTGWIWIGVFVVAMSGGIVSDHGWIYGPQFFGMYIAVYVLMASYSVTLKNADLAQAQSDELVDELRAAHEQLRRYAASAAELASMRERNRIARDLHDSVTQTIFSMTLITESALILQKQDPSQLDARLTQLSGLANDALTQMRALIAELRDAEARPGGLDRAITELVTDVGRDYDLTTHADVAGKIPALNPEIERQLTSIVQEALNNVVKHSKATTAIVRLQFADRTLTVEVEDDGFGFDTTAIRDVRAHIGLSSMRERAEEIGARLSIGSAHGKGTVVTVELPLPEANPRPGEEADREEDQSGDR